MNRQSVGRQTGRYGIHDAFFLGCTGPPGGGGYYVDSDHIFLGSKFLNFNIFFLFKGGGGGGGGGQNN